MPPNQVIQLLLELFLIEELPAGVAVDLGAQFRDAVFVGELLLGLVRDQAAQHVITKGEVGRRRDRPTGHDDDGADGDPERHRAETDLAAGMRDGVAGVARGLGRDAAAGLRAAGGAIAGGLHRMVGAGVVA